MAVLSWSSKFAAYTRVIVLLFGKMSNIITPFASQNTVAVTLPADGYVLNSFDDSELYSLAHNNEPQSHVHTPDAKENHTVELQWLEH